MKNTIKILSILFIIIMSNTSNAQIQWQKSLGGSDGDVPYDVKQTSDGGYIVVGYTESSDGDVTNYHGNKDFWVVKLSSTGSLQWQKALGGTGNETAYSVLPTSDGGYMVAGETESKNGDVTNNKGGYDVWVVKLNSTGSIVWEKCYGGLSYDGAIDMQPTSDGGYIISGYAASDDGDVTGVHGSTFKSDFWIVKIDAAGTLQWQKALGGNIHEQANSIQQTSDGGYIVVGESESNSGDVTGNQGSYDMWVVKLNSTGTIEWQKTFGGSLTEFTESVLQANDGGYIVVGYTSSTNGDVTGNHGVSDIWIVKLSSTGTLEWKKCYGGTDTDEAYSIRKTNDGGYIVTGRTSSKNGDVTSSLHGSLGYNDYWFFKINSTGAIQWQKTFGGSQNETGFNAIQGTDGSFVIVGASYSNDYDVTNHHGTTGIPDFWVVKYTGITGIEELDNNYFSIYPNPTNNKINITTALQGNNEVQYQIINTLGATTMASKATAKDFSIDVSTLPAGIYFIHLQSGTAKTVKRFVKE